MNIEKEFSPYYSMNASQRDVELISFDKAYEVFIQIYDDDKSFIRCLTEGLLRGISTTVSVKWIDGYKDIKTKTYSDFETSLDHNRYFYGGGRERYDGLFVIEPEFWASDHFLSEEQWIKDNHFTTRFFYSSKTRGEFGKGWILGDFTDSPCAGCAKFFNVKIARDDLSMLTGWKDEDQNTPKIEEQKQPYTVKRASQFNWEAAIADVAAWLYYDADIPDINALGVQTQIIDALRQSFENRKLALPSDASLKSKARIIMGSLRSNKA